MISENIQPVMNRYQLVKIPTGLNISVEIEADSIEAVRQWALDNIDTKSRWIIKLDGKNIGEAIVIDQFTYNVDAEKPLKTTFNTTALRTRHFLTPQEAIDDYRSHLDEANLKLDSIESRLRDLQQELGFNVDYVMDGDTHGIYKDYLYISVSVAGYEYRREIDGYINA